LENLKKRQEEIKLRGEANINFQQPVQPVQMQYVYEPIDDISESSLTSSRITKIDHCVGDNDVVPVIYDSDAKDTNQMV